MFLIKISMSVRQIRVTTEEHVKNSSMDTNVSVPLAIREFNVRQVSSQTINKSNIPLEYWHIHILLKVCIIKPHPFQRLWLFLSQMNMNQTPSRKQFFFGWEANNSGTKFCSSCNIDKTMHTHIIMFSIHI